MALRKDPLCAAAEIILAAEEAAGQRDDAVATVGRITASPGAVNVIPGSVTLSLDIRHLEPDVANAVIEQIRRMGETACQKRGVEMDYQVPPLQEREAKLFDPGVQAVIEAACREIDRVADRGATILQGRGGYGGAPKDVVLCACSNKQLYEIEHAMQNMDPSCFIIMLQSNEVHGEGFRQLELGKGEDSK